MNKIATGVVLLTTVLFTACGGNDTPEVDKSIMPAADSNKAATATPATSSEAAAVTQQQPASLQAPPTVTTAVPSTQVQQQAQTISAAQASKAMPSAGLNPAHGQPGHRCDIAVGAPLNSPPATTTAPQVQTVPAQPIAAPASTAPADPNAKLNPPHGQPGHDCSIAVGAPLKKS